MTKTLFEEAIEMAQKESLNEHFESDGKFYVYHLTPEKNLKSIGEVGFERLFTGRNAGNMYGPGTYTTFDLDSSKVNAARGFEYGKALLKIVVKSLRNFIIWDHDIAKRQYGTDDIDFQFKKVLPPDCYERLKNYPYYDRIIRNPDNPNRTSVCAQNLWAYLRNIDRKADAFIDGMIFFGNRDGKVCVVRDYGRLYPVEISYDEGKTFKPFDVSSTFEKFAKNDVDLTLQLKKLGWYDNFSEVPEYFLDNFARVRSKFGGYNFFYRKNYTHGLISPVDFDEAPRTFTNKGTATVVLNDNIYILKLTEPPIKFSVYNKEGQYICNLKDFDTYLEMSKINNANDDDDWS